MNQKLISAALGAIFLALSMSAEAQPTRKVFRIGFLDGSTASGMAGVLDAFRQELNRLGWTEGKNITIDARFGEQKK